ncbi:MAG: hypothetical protein HY302_07950 [Opitutae bacterium]|nr:hypothetical protein [Opitutae bacterium]
MDTALPPLAPQLFALDPGIRYVAVNQGGRIVELTQRGSAPTNNPPETDRMEELFVNPTVLDLTRRRGELDLGGVRYVVVRYGPMFQLLLPYRAGHLSVGLELSVDPVAVARRIAGQLGLPV